MNALMFAVYLQASYQASGRIDRFRFLQTLGFADWDIDGLAR